ncbi:hypothetical protein FB451DRAFT_1129494 [Mycena latifolia]|nr:hypothetical protein FB451DRAFT_1129494 [Mycena latifolia]
MPRLSSRQSRAREVFKTFVHHHTSRVKKALRWKNKIKRTFVRAGLAPEDGEALTALSLDMREPPDIDMLSVTSGSSGSSASSSISGGLSSTSDTTSENWSDLLGSDWRRSSSSSSASSDSLFDSSSDEGMPDLHPAGYPDSDEEDESDSDSDSSSSRSDSGDDADDEGHDWDDLEMEGVFHDRSTGFQSTSSNYRTKWVRHNLEEMYSHRYEQPRDTFPRGPAFLRHVLRVLKNARPDLFRQELRVSPFTFDKLVRLLADDPVFANNSSNAQMAIEDQVAIVLYRFGHSGNAAGLQKVANWAGVAKGTITLITRRVMTAILRPDFMTKFVRMPTASEKEKSKAWIQAHSCKAWRDGWCMVDGTLIALFDRPFWFGQSYFDRKRNYSLNIQVCAFKYLCLSLTRSFSRSYHFPTCASSTSATVLQEARMTRRHGRELASPKSTICC